MRCTHCGLWELAAGDLVCSWCGTSYLRFTVTLDPPELPAADYPPPVQLYIHNESPLAALTVEHIQPDRSWISLLPGQPLPRSLDPGCQQVVLLDVDTFAAGDADGATVAVTARYASADEIATLRLQPAQPAGI